MRQAKKSMEEKNSRNHAIIFNPKNYEIISEGSNNSENPISHCVMNAISQMPSVRTGQKRNSEESFSSCQYLCKGLDIIIYQEPCLMCSMALVHSRIRRVYYSKETPVDSPFKGGLNEGMNLTEVPEINHKYLVFQMD